MKRLVLLFALFLVVGLITACQGKQEKPVYEGKVFYEIFVRAFNDSNGDGTGDIKGVIEKLDYIEELGFEGIWLMPINQSPSYHGYDVTDYYAINEDYGTLEDLKQLIKEAHNRDMMVIMDMVINHTSSEHPWFREASTNPNSRYRDFYLFTEDDKLAKEPSPMQGAGKPWVKSSVRDEYYYALFWGGMPDLNLDSEELRQELKNITRFYLDMGIDGFRLDAVKYAYNDLESNLTWWKEYDSYVKSINPKAVLVGEIWDSASYIAAYQNTLDSAFVFSVGESIISSLQKNSMNYLGSNIKDYYDRLTTENPSFVPAPFLTNHDQIRAMNQIGNIDKYKAAAAIYLTLPGAPFVYYGEEIGMKGTKPDERIREPFLWSEDSSKNTSWIDATNDSTIALENQIEDEDSIYNFYKEIINLRKNNPVLKYGALQQIDTDKSKLYGIKRSYHSTEAYVLVSIDKEAATIEIPQGKYSVLYSNKRDEKTLKSDTSLTVQPGEILIIKK